MFAPRIQPQWQKLAHMLTEISLGLQSALCLGRLKDDGHPPVELTRIMKRKSCGKALDMARMAGEVIGGK